MIPLTHDARRLAQCSAILLCAILAMLGWGVWHSGAGVIGWRNGDMAASYFYWRQFGFAQLARGGFPGWNPHTFCGNPFAANFEAAIAYPLNWMFLILPTATGINLSVVLHLWLGGFLTIILARRLALGWSAALLAGLVYTLSGPMLGRVYVGHITILSVLAWWPGMLLCVEQLLRRPTPRMAALGALSYGLAITAGHPQVLYYSSLLAVVYTAVRMVQMGRASAGALPWLAASAALGVALGAMPLAVTWLAQAEGSRQALTSAAASTFALPPSGLVGALVPWFFGDGIRSPYWGPWYLWEVALYAGILPAMLAVVAVAGTVGNRRSPALAHALLLAVALVVAVSPATPLFRVLYGFLPGFSSFRGTGKILGPALLPLAMLAGFGLERLAASRAPLRREAIAALGVLLLLAVAGVGILATVQIGPARGLERWAEAFHARGALLEIHPGHVHQFSAQIASAIHSQMAVAAIFIVLSTAALLLVCTGHRHRRAAVLGVLMLDLFLAHRVLIATFPSTSRIPPPALASWSDPLHRVHILDPALSPNAAMLARFRTASGYEPLYPRRFGEFINAVNGRPRVHYDPLPEPTRLDGLFRVTATSAAWDGQALLPVANPLPRVRFFSNAIVAADAEEGWRLLASPAFDPATTLLLDGATPHPTRADETATPTLALDSPSRVEIALETRGGGYLFLADNWHSGWAASVNGEPAPIHPAYRSFRAVEVPAGPALVQFVYTPPSLRPGLLATLAGLLAVAAMLAWPRRPAGGGSS